MMHIHNGTLAAQGPVGVNLHQSNAALNAKSGLTMYIPIDASALVKDVYPDMAAFAKVGGRMRHQQLSKRVHHEEGKRRGGRREWLWSRR